MSPQSSNSAANAISGDLLELVREACLTDPDRAALIFEDGLVVSRATLWSEVTAFAGYLSSRLSPGDRIAIMMSNRTEFMITWLAAVASRCALVPLNPALRSHDASHVLRDSGARLIVTEPAHESLLRDLQADCPELEEIAVVSDDEPAGLAAFARSWDDRYRPAEARDDITNVYYTSGTTGPPKGCLVGHDYWLRFATILPDLYDWTDSDRMLCCLQFFYNDPPWQLLVALKRGTSLVVMRRFSVSRYWQVVREHHVTLLFGIASTASLLLKAPSDARDRDHEVRLAIHVGIPALLHKQLVERWGVPWVEAYGLTETGAVTAMPVEYASNMIGSSSIGLPVPGAEVRIVDETGQTLPAGQAGELVVRAPGLMRGYLNRPEATADTLRGGWLHTGDLASADEAGFLYFRGRMKDIIRRAGQNIAAAEVENVLRSHTAVLEVAAVPAPDPLRGEEVKVHVLLAPGWTPESAPPQELVMFAAERLARYKVPRYVEYRSADFERTPSMRVKKEPLDRRGEAPGVWDREKSLGW
jgi:carnitine-CoA ligase